jgi:hypothetical protein
MTNKKKLQQYLPPFLLDEVNNGKTIMLSGAWGAGKTHFWQNEIEPDLLEKLKDKEDKKACVYVSLYGKEDIETLKNEILFKAYESIHDENKVKKRAISAFGIGSKALSLSFFGFKLDLKGFSEKVEAYDEEKKTEEAKSFLMDGGVICLDDFERKSKKIDLNDLFGFISQLSIDMNCKVVIILNDDVFNGKEAEVFRNLKEKTVNKFLFFKPTIEELFESIAKDKKYNDLVDYKTDILKAIKETEELNARIYIQVLDNCLKWLYQKGFSENNILRLLVLSTVNFIKNHIVYEYNVNDSGKKKYKFIESFFDIYEISNYLMNRLPQHYDGKGCSSHKELLHMMNSSINEEANEKNKSEEYSRKLNGVFNNNKKLFEAFAFYIHVLKIDDIEENIYNEINNFIKSGILI